MTITHHPEHVQLLEYAAGDLKESVSLIIATHLALCPTCRNAVSDAEMIGGVYLDSMRPEAISDSALSSIMRRLDFADDDQAIVYEKHSGQSGDGKIDGVSIPEPLRSSLDVSESGSLNWLRMAAGIDRIDITNEHGVVARMLRIDAGRAMPRHGHSADEQTLVLSGGFSDEFGHFGPGDIECADEDVVHRPVADASEPCICLIVADAPIRLSGPFGKLLQPFVRF